MIGQQFSLRYLIPLAIEHLETDIFIEGHYFPGDLLNNVLAVDKKFWIENKDLWVTMNEMIKDKKDEIAKEGIPTNIFYNVF